MQVLKQSCLPYLKIKKMYNKGIKKTSIASKTNGRWNWNGRYKGNISIKERDNRKSYEYYCIYSSFVKRKLYPDYTDDNFLKRVRIGKNKLFVIRMKLKTHKKYEKKESIK